MKKLLLFAVCALIFGASSFAQLRYPVSGTYKKEAAQGMAILGDTAYLLSNGGRCRVYDLKTETVTGEFMLQSSWEGNHANTASFGWEIPEGGDKPALYITECYGECRLFVESVLEDRSELVQTIRAYDNGKTLGIHAWAVDAENRFLYSFHNGKKTGSEDGSVNVVVTKFRLPRLDEGEEVVFTEKDVLDRFTVAFPNLTQGVTQKGHYLYMVTGNSERARGKQNAVRALKVIDLRKNELVKSIDLTHVTTCEPEDVDFYKGRMLLYCGGDGGIFEIKHK